MYPLLGASRIKVKVSTLIQEYRHLECNTTGHPRIARRSSFEWKLDAAKNGKWQTSLALVVTLVVKGPTWVCFLPLNNFSRNRMAGIGIKIFREIINQQDMETCETLIGIKKVKVTPGMVRSMEIKFCLHVVPTETV